MSKLTRRLPVVLLVPLLLSGCKDPLRAGGAASSLVILRNAVPFEEQTIAVGETLQLSASLRDAANRPLEGRSVEWSSSDGSVASVDASGVVRGLKVGRTWIRAVGDGVRDSARVNVSDRLTGAAACAPGETPISLPVGGVHVTSAYDTPTLCIDGGSAGADYVLVPFHASGVAGGAAGSRLAVELTAAGTVNPLSTVEPGEVAPLLERSAFASETRGDDDFHIRLRERTLPELRPRLRSLRAEGGAEPSFSTISASASVGDVLQLNVRTDSACAQPSNRSARVVAVSSRAIVVADESNPAGGFTAAEYAGFAARFDELVYPLGVQNFGEPHDLDGNQRVLIFFTRAVNDLTRPGEGYYVGGFFFDRDLFPRTGDAGCAGSNVAEILYLMVPDEQRGVSERAFRKENVARRTLAVIGHELQHLINASRRLHVNRAAIWEEMWLNEGLSHVMEELLFYRVTGLTPGGNHGSEILQAHRSAFEEYQIDNFERLVQYLATPANHSLMAGNTLALRGAAWSFLRYAADRRGGSQRDLWFALANSRAAGMANLEAALPGDPRDWTHDWSVSLFTDDHRDTDGRFQQPSWNSRSIVPATRALLGHLNPTYPLAPQLLQSSSSAPSAVLSLQSGGASFHRFGVPAGGAAAVRATSGGLQAPGKLRLALVRTR